MRPKEYQEYHDEAGKLIAKEYYYGAGVLTAKLKYKYNGAGERIQIDHYNGANKLIYKYYYKAGIQTTTEQYVAGEIINKECCLAGERRGKHEHTLNEVGELIATKSGAGAAYELITRDIYESGKLTKTEYYKSRKLIAEEYYKGGKLTYYWKYTYNRTGEPIKKEYYNEAGKVIKKP